ncbi:hypothetical protein [Streptomyces sp. NPDC127039]|uniref:hypothetical protein n=1 Tax=Streptomyces sp. NPDC127039 TaxID=3347115 RepID=UPI00365B78AD
MSLFDPIPPGHRPDAPVGGENPAVARLRSESRRLRGRLLAVNLSALTVVLLLPLMLGGSAAVRFAGPFTIGMALLGVQVLTMLASVVWYDRACGTYCDPRADELKGSASTLLRGPEGQL